MKKLLLLLLCVPLIGLGQSKKKLNLIISQKSDSLELLENQLLIQNNQFLDKIKIKEHSILSLEKEIIDLKQELNLAINKTNENTNNVFHMNVISYYDDMEDRYSDGSYDEDHFFNFYDLPGKNNNDKYNLQTNELINGKVYNFYNNPFSSFNGYVKCEYNFKNGKLHGLVVFYDDYKGKYFLSNSIEYRNGKRNGFYRKWFENGQLREECIYIEDKLDGEFKEFWEDGTLHGGGNFKNGKPIGEHRYYNEKGVLVNEEFYSESFENYQGELLQKWYYDNGQLRMERYNEDRETSKCWDEDGNEKECFK
jgi:antitoxin component YwqK of YwqJK toxin-antitoxin module